MALLLHQGNLSIVHVDLGQNKFSHSGFISIFEALANNSKLDSLDVSNQEGANKNKINRKAFKSLRNMLEGQQKNGCISQIDFGNIGLGDEGIECIAEGINGTRIRKLGLRNNQITSKGVQFFVEIGFFNGDEMSPVLTPIKD